MIRREVKAKLAFVGRGHYTMRCLFFSPPLLILLRSSLAVKHPPKLEITKVFQSTIIVIKKRKERTTGQSKMLPTKEIKS